ncbi:androgen-dependent TFPI-regulating protein isoform X5 [Panthera leo]|uniref:androgen-dependent TFPI-regulating protein isoform X5 n=1 Tax=Panthera leo TaxID=9689 RepID=UPI001C6A45F7|nr:androgen-dependent TFPI-regulating protein isoform X5 [Panthera leo]
MAPRSELAMRRTCTCIYHFLVWSWYLFLNYYISKQGGDQRKSKIFLNGGQWKYLTFLNLLLQAIFYGVACVEDVLKRIKGERDLKFVTAFRDLLFTTLAFPISTFVFLSFWILFLYDRELVYPKALDGIFPEWLNHAMRQHKVPPCLWLLGKPTGSHSDSCGARSSPGAGSRCGTFNQPPAPSPLPWSLHPLCLWSSHLCPAGNFELV